MTRRNVVAALGAAAIVRPSAGAERLTKPRALKVGDTVGLITPATYVADPDRIALAERTIGYFNLKPRMGRNVRRRSGYVGGTADERAADLHDMFRDPEVKAVFCIRGGYGSAHLLDRIDYDLIRKNPKILLGYSDITSLHLAIHKKTGLVTFHGPVVLSRFTAYTQKHFRAALFESKPLGVLTNPPETEQLRPSHTLRTVRPGKGRGPLVGGNLSLIAATMGTPYEIETEGKILFIEDVGEQPYEVDRMLTQLKLAGKLQSSAGIIFGECSECVPRQFQPSFESTFSLGEVVDAILSDLKVPVLSGLTIGHTSDQLTLPLGVMASLDADKGELTVEEAAVA
jgi:muramoyltetrapeptide carboxypeptidase